MRDSYKKLLPLVEVLGFGGTVNYEASEVDSTESEVACSVTNEVVTSNEDNVGTEDTGQISNDKSILVEESQEDIAQKWITASKDKKSSNSRNIGDDNCGAIGFSGKDGIQKASTGTVIYLPTDQLPYNHVALFTSPDFIVEALGPGMNSRHIKSENVKPCLKTANSKIEYYKGVYSNGETFSASRREAIAKRALYTYVKVPYDSDFANNKGPNNPEANSVNCSELVWRSFKYPKGGGYDGKGSDIDGNGGSGVYPKDIRKAKSLQLYKSVPLDWN